MEASKKRRYDRQLRMWGEHGQDALERCRLCLLNGSATGTEVLKNLVLPGIGSFTVVDGALVTPRDLGNNFFLEQADVGRPRAECVTALLKELNEHVRGSYVHEDVDTLLRSNPSFLDDFSIIVATQLPEHTLRFVAEACADRNLPLVVLRAYGLLGTVRLALAEHVVIEAHSDNVPADLRVCAPFAELVAFARERFGDLSALSGSQRKHVPYVVLLLHALDQYRQRHGGELPRSYKEKQELKASLAALAESWFGVGGADDALNFEEAKLAANTALTPPSIPAGTRAVLDEAEARLLSQKPVPPSEPAQSPTVAASPIAIRSRNFWLLAAALGRFVAQEGNGQLPLFGAIPDMTADTESYVELANLYRAKAAADAAHVHAHAQAIVLAAGLPDDAITLEQTRLFCKNAHSLQFMRYRSIAQELTPATAQVSRLAALMEEGGDAPAVGFYMLLRAADAFFARYNRWPGTMDDNVESDVSLLKQCVAQLLGEYRQTGTTLAVRDDLVFEMCRYGAAELHPVASIIGGVASQEVIKLVTGQFVPLNNTYIYNGLNGTGVVAEF